MSEGEPQLTEEMDPNIKQLGPAVLENINNEEPLVLKFGSEKIALNGTRIKAFSDYMKEGFVEDLSLHVRTDNNEKISIFPGEIKYKQNDNERIWKMVDNQWRELLEVAKYPINDDVESLFRSIEADSYYQDDFGYNAILSSDSSIPVHVKLFNLAEQLFDRIESTSEADNLERVNRAISILEALAKIGPDQQRRSAYDYTFRPKELLGQALYLKAKYSNENEKSKTQQQAYSYFRDSIADYEFTEGELRSRSEYYLNKIREELGLNNHPRYSLASESRDLVSNNKNQVYLTFNTEDCLTLMYKNIIIEGSNRQIQKAFPQQEESFRVKLNPNLLHEGSNTITIQIADFDGGIIDGTIITTEVIIDNDSPVIVNIDPESNLSVDQQGASYLDLNLSITDEVSGIKSINFDNCNFNQNNDSQQEQIGSSPLKQLDIQDQVEIVDPNKEAVVTVVDNAGNENQMTIYRPE
jgi:hypothetical protein